MISTLINGDPELLKEYVLHRSEIRAKLESSEEEIKETYDRTMVGRIAAGIEVDSIRSEWLLSEAFRKIPDSSTEPLFYFDGYVNGWLKKLATELELLKHINEFKLEVPFKSKMERVSSETFTRAVRHSDSRIDYRCHFGDKLIAKNVKKLSSYSELWSLPIPRTWYQNVYKQNIAMTDISGKKVVVLNAKLLPDEEQQTWGKDEEVKIFKGIVGYVKKEAKGRIVQAAVSHDFYVKNYLRLAITYSDFQKLNPTFEKDHPNMDIYPETNSSKSARFLPTFTIISCKPNVSKSKERIVYNTYKSDTVSYVEPRYILRYKHKLMDEYKVVSSTSPKRVISVMKNRLVIETAKTHMGVV